MPDTEYTSTFDAQQMKLDACKKRCQELVLERNKLEDKSVKLRDDVARLQAALKIEQRMNKITDCGSGQIAWGMLNNVTLEQVKADLLQENEAKPSIPLAKVVDGSDLEEKNGALPLSWRWKIPVNFNVGQWRLREPLECEIRNATIISIAKFNIILRTPYGYRYSADVTGSPSVSRADLVLRGVDNVLREMTDELTSLLKLARTDGTRFRLANLWPLFIPAPDAHFLRDNAMIDDAEDIKADLFVEGGDAKTE